MLSVIRPDFEVVSLERTLHLYIIKYVNYIKLSRNCITIPNTIGLTFIKLKFIRNVNSKSKGLWNTILAKQLTKVSTMQFKK